MTHARPCNDYGNGGCTEKGRADPGFCQCKADVERVEMLERVLTQVHDWLKPNGSVMRGDQLCIAPHGWVVIRQSVAAALAHKPAAKPAEPA